VPEAKVLSPKELKFRKISTDTIHKVACGADFSIIVTTEGAAFVFGTLSFVKMKIA
jgi:alpha-tubulin suppressor-like RCC1 family protein